MSSETAKNLLAQAGLEDLNEEDEDFDMTSSHGMSTTNGDLEGGEPANDGAKEMRDTVIKKEEKAVNRSRALVGVAVSLCAIAVTVAVYIISKRGDRNSFEIEVSEPLHARFV